MIDGIATEICQATEEESVKLCHATTANLENNRVANRLEEFSLQNSTRERKFNSIRKLSYKIFNLTCCIIQCRLESCIKQEMPDVQAGFRKD